MNSEVKKVGITELLAEAEAQIDTYSVEQVKQLFEDEDTLLVDLRDIRELWREGTIAGAYHAPRGMLEFWIAEDSPYTKKQFQQDKQFIFFCAAGSRSALAGAIAKRLGLARVAHLGGGFKAWTDAGYPTIEKEKK